MSETIKLFIIGILIPVYVINLMGVVMNRPDMCRMNTLLHYFPTNWISCELTKPRFQGDDK